MWGGPARLVLILLHEVLLLQEGLLLRVDIKVWRSSEEGRGGAPQKALRCVLVILLHVEVDALSNGLHRQVIIVYKLTSEENSVNEQNRRHAHKPVAHDKENLHLHKPKH